MNAQVLHVVVHNPEQVRQIIAEARVIADDLAVDRDAGEMVFNQACTLLAARYSVLVPQQEVSVPLPLMSIPRGRH